MNVDWEQRAKELQAELDLAKSLMTVSEAGKRGGTAVRDKYGLAYYQQMGQKGGRMVAAMKGREFYSRIGKLGGTAVAAQRGSEFFSRIGTIGGAKVKATHAADYYSEIGRRGGRRAGRKPHHRTPDGEMATTGWAAELRALREQAGLRQADVAASAGCTVALVSHVECGRRPADEARWRARYEQALAGR